MNEIHNIFGLHKCNMQMKILPDVMSDVVNQFQTVPSEHSSEHAILYILYILHRDM